MKIMKVFQILGRKNTLLRLSLLPRHKRKSRIKCCDQIMASIKKGSSESLVFSIILYFKIKATSSNGRNFDTYNTTWLSKTQHLTVRTVKLMVKSLARSKATYALQLCC